MHIGTAPYGLLNCINLPLPCAIILRNCKPPFSNATINKFVQSDTRNKSIKKYEHRLITKVIEEELDLINKLILTGIMLCLLQLPCAYGLYEKENLNYYIDHINDGNNLTRIEAITHIGDLGDVRGTDALILSLRSDGDWRVRSAAARTLGKINDKNAVEPLIYSLSSDTNEYVRSDAAWALGVLNSTKAIGPLTEALKDEDSDVRSSAAYALGKLGAGKEALLKSLSDKDADVRLAANWSLDRIRQASSLE
jgi:HEAT repeat protein